MISLDLLTASDGRLQIPGYRVRSTIDQVVGGMPRQTWSDWCKRFDCSGAKTAWIDLDSAAGLLTMAHLSAKGVRSYQGELYEALYQKARDYWLEYAGRTNERVS